MKSGANGFVNCTLAAVPAQRPLSDTSNAATRLYYPFVLAQSLCFGLLFPFTSTLSGYSNCASVQTQLASRLHTRAPALRPLRKQRLISGQARCVHPVWLLSLPRTSKLGGFVGHSSGWIEVRDGACVPRRRQGFAYFFHNATDLHQNSVLSINLNVCCRDND